MKSLTFGLGLTKRNLILDFFTPLNFIPLSLKSNYIILKTKFTAFDAKGSLNRSLLLVCNKCSIPIVSYNTKQPLKLQVTHVVLTLVTLDQMVHRTQ